MIYGSVCSGIEAATVAWEPLGWKPAFFSEIDAFPRAVLTHHYPTVPLHGDFTTIGANEYGAIDLLVGGTPCQDFSVAGLRAGIAGDRGNLTLEFLRLAERKKPRWIVWENVPGVLSSDGGRALGAFLGGLAELGYGFAYRVLDAQYFGLAQRRARVFVVGYLGDWRRAAAVLFERESLQGHPAPRREAGQRIANSLVDRPDRGGGNSEGQRLITDWPASVAPTLNAHFGDKQGLEDQHALNGAGLFTLAHTLRAEGFDASEDGTGRGTPLIAFSVKDHGADAGPLSPTLRAGGFDKSHANGGVMPAVAFSSRFKGDDGRGYERPPQSYIEHVGAIDTVTRHSVAANSVVRRLTPRECCRLQGFPDDYLDITYRGKPAADGPKYKSLGNSMAVPCMRWLGERIEMVERLTKVS